MFCNIVGNFQQGSRFGDNSMSFLLLWFMKMSFNPFKKFKFWDKSWFVHKQA